MSGHPFPSFQRSLLHDLELFALCFLTSTSSAAAPLDKLAAVWIVGIKGEVTVMSRAACFPLSQLRTSTSAGRVQLKSGVMPLLYSHSKMGTMAKLNNHVMQMVVMFVYR